MSNLGEENLEKKIKSVEAQLRGKQTDLGALEEKNKQLEYKLKEFSLKQLKIETENKRYLEDSLKNLEKKWKDYLKLYEEKKKTELNRQIEIKQNEIIGLRQKNLQKINILIVAGSFIIILILIIISLISLKATN